MKISHKASSFHGHGSIHWAFVLLGATLVFGACRDPRDTCKHYVQKSFSPPPPNAVESCSQVCLEHETAAACRQAADWYKELDKIDEHLKFSERACELGDKHACRAADFLAIEARNAAYNDKVRALRKTLHACIKDPEPCQRDCDAGDLNACMQLADRAYLGFKGYGKDLSLANTLYQRVCEMHDTTHFCWSDFIVDARFCAVPDTRKPCDEEHDGGCPGPPKPLHGCAEVSPHDHISDVAKHLALCNGQRACDTIVRTSCLDDIERCQNACDEHNDAARCRQISRMYRDGLGLPADMDKAQEYVDKACALGFKDHRCRPFKRDHRYIKPVPLPAATTSTPKAPAVSPNADDTTEPVPPDQPSPDRTR